jgi:hypothetical protein
MLELFAKAFLIENNSSKLGEMALVWGVTLLVFTIIFVKQEFSKAL